MADRPGKKMAEAAVKKALAEEMMYEAPDMMARKSIQERVAKAGREAEDEVKREMRGVKMKKGGYVPMKKKAKRYAEGGLAGIADAANSLIGDVDNMASIINYGTNTPSSGASGPIGFNAVTGMKKGGTVKSTASKRGDGCAQRGKTKGRMV